MAYIPKNFITTAIITAATKLSEYPTQLGKMMSDIKNYMSETVGSAVTDTAESAASAAAKAQEAQAALISVQTLATSVSSGATTALNAVSSATQSAANAQASANACAALTNMMFGGFSMVDGELIVSYNSAVVSTPSIVNGELILTY